MMTFCQIPSQELHIMILLLPFDTHVKEPSLFPFCRKGSGGLAKPKVTLLVSVETTFST